LQDRESDFLLSFIAEIVFDIWGLHLSNLFTILGAFAKFRKRLTAPSCLSVYQSVCVSNRPHNTTQIPPDVIS